MSFVPSELVKASGVVLTVRSIDGNLLELESADGAFFGFRHINSVERVPAAQEPAAAVVAHSAPVGSGGAPSRANLDCADKLVKRGQTVVWGGWRCRVQRVRTGRCLVSFVGPRGGAPTHPWPDRWLPCASVQVVA